MANNFSGRMHHPRSKGPVENTEQQAKLPANQSLALMTILQGNNYLRYINNVAREY
jgi:DNA-binding transcriptional regulator YiaG